VFGYRQVASAYGSGNFINVLHESFPGADQSRPNKRSDSIVVTSRVAGKDDIYDSLRTFFGAGK